MKFSAVLATLAVFAFLVSAARAADSAPTPPKSDFSQAKTADEFWKQVEKLQQPPAGPRPASQEEMRAQLRAWFATQRAAVDAFLQAYPNDSRRWQAKMISLRSGLQIRRLGGGMETLAVDLPILDQIMGDPDAPAPLKGEAAFMSATEKGALVDPSRPETYLAFHQAAADFFARFGEHPLAAQVQSLQLRTLVTDPTPQGADTLKKLAASSDPKIARTANEIIAHRRQIDALKSKPIDLKFTAVNGQPVDFAKLRGKVVLIEFWASSCVPCIVEMPNLVAAYEKFHGKGFEIVGVCLDSDKASMDAILKKQGVAWTQYFDGGGWENKISSAFGIRFLPATWLIDKQGKLRETDLHGEALAPGVEKLLAE